MLLGQDTSTSDASHTVHGHTGPFDINLGHLIFADSIAGNSPYRTCRKFRGSGDKLTSAGRNLKLT